MGRAAGLIATLVSRLFEIIHEDADLLVVNKLAGLVCHPTKGDAHSSLIGRLRLYLGEQFQPRLVNRLDRETSGLVLVAKNFETASELGKIMESRTVQKIYLAIVHGCMGESHGLIDAPLGRDQSSRIAVKDRVRPDGAPAQTEFWVQRNFQREGGDFTLLRVAPLTGRKHQIRIHLAHRGHPIVGDKLYGANEDCYLALVEDRLTAEHRRHLLLPCQALHAGQLKFRWRAQPWTFQAEPEAWFTAFLE
jgi:23S rRNA pseudouridine1911/1915/1917 synthase